MLYRTHHHHHQYIRNPSFFRSSSSNKFPCPPPSTEATTTTFSSAASTSVASLLKGLQGREEEMECLGVNLGAKAAGLLRPEYLGGFVLKRGQYHQQQQLQSQQQQQQGFLMEEILASNGTTNAVSNDDLCLVDEFLNFASEEGQEDVDVSVAAEAAAVVFGEESKLEKEEEKFTTISSSPTPPTPQSPKEVKRKEKEEEISDPATTTAADDFGSVLAVPAEEKDLEWLSHFVEESFSQFSTPYPSGILPRKPSANSKSEPELPETHQFAAPFLTKARRSKRVRAGAGARVWSFGSYDSAATTTSSSTSSSPNSPPSPTTWEASAPPQTAAFKKPRKSGGWAGSGLGPHASSAPRKCSHCGVQKTPQWRTGPMGAKTLCNACGVRYKSGRLLPEYRPACSPTFSSELHSNNHRKVLEMRRKKETTVVMTTGTGPESGFAPPVPSF